MIYGDELAPSGGNAGGGIYKFVPAIPFQGSGPITVPAQSPLASGTIYGLRVAASGSSNWGQGAETGNGAWVAVNLAGANVVDVNGNIILRNAQALQRFTGYYRPEDMDIDPIAARTWRVQSVLGQHRPQEPHRQQPGREQRRSKAKSCASSRIRRAPRCPRQRPAPSRPSSVSSPAARNAACTTTSRSSRTRAISSSSRTAPSRRVKSLNPLTTELRGNDLWICLPDGRRRRRPDRRLRALCVGPRHER